MRSCQIKLRFLQNKISDYLIVLGNSCCEQRGKKDKAHLFSQKFGRSSILIINQAPLSNDTKLFSDMKNVCEMGVDVARLQRSK